MIKLNAAFSRKVGEPNYGSRGASVNVELELESNLIGDPGALAGRIRGLFDIARQAVDEELNNAQSNDRPEASDDGQRRGNLDQRGSNDRPAVRLATTSQVRAIRAICDRQGRNADQIAAQRFGVNAVEDLTLQQASGLIDELKATAPSDRNGGRR